MRVAIVCGIALLLGACVPSQQSVKSGGSSYRSSSPNCKKGKPCGNTCIAWNKTCRK